MDLLLLHPETSSVLRHIPDTKQTPPDTTQPPPFIGVLCSIVHWKNRQYLSFITFFNILFRDLLFIHPRQPETPSDTIQTPSRHPHKVFLCNIEHYIYGKFLVLGVSGLCLWVSRWCLDAVWECLGMYWYQICWQTNYIRSRYSLSFILVLCIA